MKSSDFSDAEPTFGLVGTLELHCSPEEIRMRQETRQLDRFELALTSTLSDPEPNPRLCLKKYQRSAADKVYLPEETRTFSSCERSMDHLIDHVVECDVRENITPPFAEVCRKCTFVEIYSFFRDRTRSIRVDLHVQQPRSLQSRVFFQVHEECLRFEFLSMYLLRRSDITRSQYDDKLGLKSCSQTMEPLLHAYSLFPPFQASEHSAAIYRYVILLQIGTHQGLSFTSRLPREILSDPLVKWALKAAGAFYAEDFGRFLRLYQEADFLSAIIMGRVADFARYRILCTILRSLVIKTKETMWTLSQLQKCLRIDDPQFCTEFLKYYGIWVESENGETKVRFPRRTGVGHWDLVEWEEVLSRETVELFRTRIGSGSKMMRDWDAYPRNQDSSLVQKFSACGFSRSEIIRGACDPCEADFAPVIHPPARALSRTSVNARVHESRPTTPKPHPLAPLCPERQPAFIEPVARQSRDTTCSPALPSNAVVLPPKLNITCSAPNDTASLLPQLDDPVRERRREAGRLRRAHYFRIGRVFFAWVDVHRTEKKWRKLPIAHAMPPPKRRDPVPLRQKAPERCKNASLNELPLPTGPLVGDQDLYKRTVLCATNGPRVRDFVLNIERFLRHDASCHELPDIPGSVVLCRNKGFRRYSSALSLSSNAYCSTTRQWQRTGFVNLALIVLGNGVPLQRNRETADRLDAAEVTRLLALHADEYHVLFYLEATAVHTVDEVEITRQAVENVFHRSLGVQVKTSCVGSVLHGVIRFDPTRVEHVLATSNEETAVDILDEVKAADWILDIFFEQFYNDDDDGIAFAPRSRVTGERIPYWPYSERWVQQCWDTTWEYIRASQADLRVNRKDAPPEWYRIASTWNIPKTNPRQRFETKPLDYWLGLRRDLRADYPQTISLPRKSISPADLQRVDTIATRTELKRRRRHSLFVGDVSSSVGDFSEFMSDNTASICASVDFVQRDREQSAWERERVKKRMKQYENALALIQNAGVTK